MYLLLPSTHDFIVDIRKSNSDILEILYMTLVYLFNGNYEEGKLNWLLSCGDKIQEIRSLYILTQHPAQAGNLLVGQQILHMV